MYLFGEHDLINGKDLLLKKKYEETQIFLKLSGIFLKNMSSNSQCYYLLDITINQVIRNMSLDAGHSERPRKLILDIKEYSVAIGIGKEVYNCMF